MKSKGQKCMRMLAVVAGVVALSVAMIFSSLSVPFALAAEGGFTSEYDSREEVLRDGSELNKELAAEGFVLLKNANNALPLSREERNVSLLGAETYQTPINGGGSSRVSRPGGGEFSWVSSTNSTVVSSLTQGGFNINPRISARYGSGAGANGDRNTYMTPLESGEGVVTFGGEAYDLSDENFLDGADDNFSRYGDVAIISLSRAGSEGADNVSFGAEGHSDQNEHYLTLNDSERQILAYAKYHKEVVGDINKIVVIVNSPAVMELGDIQDDDAFDAMLWIGLPGWNGADVIADILTGAVNPSGRTVDFWMRDFRTDPTWYAFGNYSQASYVINNGQYQVPEGNPGMNYGERYDFGQVSTSYKAPTMEHDPEGVLENVTANAVTYSEGIFMGYRYYESVAADIGGEAGETWYDANTLYPFGYGLSYTTFEQEIVEVRGDLAAADGEITVSVRVRNTGNAAGKDVVQLYNTPEYTPGGIDKAEVNLVGFEKTDTLRPGASQTVDVTIAVKDLAEFDYNDANANDNSGYELETGEYVLSVRANSHEVYDSYTLNAETLLTWDEDGDPSTPNNIYSQESGAWEMYNTNAEHWTTSGDDMNLHRDGLLNEEGTGPSDLSELAWMLTDENEFRDEAFNVLQKLGANNPNGEYGDYDNPVTLEQETDYTGNLWLKTAADMQGRTQGTGVAGENGLYETILADMMGVDFDDPAWDTFLDQLTWTEIVNLVSSAGYNTGAVPTIGKERVTDADAPAQLNGQGWGWVCEAVVASTWNKDLAYEQGKVVGNESMWLRNAANGGIGWYGPAMNIHRNPLAGRNFEYYSQDGLQSGIIGAAVVKGATDVGARVYVKHAFLNDQETSRVGVVTLVNEQALRTVYAKPFELAVKDGNANGLMTSFNTIGLASSTSYATNIQLYVNEWGYKGINVTDYWMGPDRTGWYGYSMIRGLTVPLGSIRGDTAIQGTWDAAQNTVVVDGVASYTQWYWARQTAKYLLYTHINSNGGRNGFTPAASTVSSDIEATQYAELEDTSVVNADVLDDVFGASGYTVSISGGTLPEGLEINDQGILSGTPVQSGTFAVTLRITGENGMAWISGSTDSVTINVAEGEQPPVTFGVTLSSSAGTATLGQDYTNGVTASFVGLTEDTNWWPEGEADEDTYNNGNGYIGSVQYSAEGLPAGMTIDSTGAISGTPLQVGTYTVTVNATVQHVTRGGQWWDPTYSSEDVTYSAQLTITVDGGYNVTIANGTHPIEIGVATGETTTVQALLESAVFDDIELPGIGMTVAGLSATQGGAMLEGSYSVEEGTDLYVVWNYPELTIIDGNWWINGVDTGIQAAGSQGPAGDAGQDGQDGQNGQDGEDGLNGVGIVSVERISSEGLVDTYRITLSNGEYFDFTVTNGAQGEQGPQGEQGEQGPQGEQGEQGPQGQQGPAGQGGADADGGCGSAVNGLVAFALAIPVIAIAAYVAHRKNKKDVG